MIKFPSIDQFRNTVKAVRSAHDYYGKDTNGDPIYEHKAAYPIIWFTGTVKLHGTNAGIVKYKDRIEFQSRERVLDLQHDNAGFMLAMMGKNLDFLFKDWEYKDHVAIFGEWCGQGIQSGVAISSLQKMFVIFAIMVDGEWVGPHDPVFTSPEQGIYSIGQFQTSSIPIDFNSPDIIQNSLIEMTQSIENQCPVGKHFGVDGVGEGMVWKAKHNGVLYQFKVKGDKHSVSKVKTLASVDVEMVENILEFVENTVTEPRLRQGLSWLKENNKELSQKSTGDFLRWVITDIMKEESDTIVANQIDVKKANSIISNKARLWYFDRLFKDN